MDILINLKELQDFFEKHPINKHILGNFPYLSEHRIGDYLIAFRHFKLTEEDVIPEYIEIMNILTNISNDRYHYYDGYYLNAPTEVIEGNIQALEYILNYQGFWDIEELLLLFKLNREILNKDLNQLINDFPLAQKQKKQMREKEKDIFIQKYYEKKRVLTNEQLDDIFHNKMEKKKIKANILSKDYLNVNNIKYPILLLLFKYNKFVYLSIVDKNLDQRMANYKKNKEFDGYSYIHFDEEIIYDIYAEAVVRYNPRNLTFNVINTSNSIYRSLNQIKQRYKGVKDIDLWVIKKVIGIYEIPTYTLNGGQVVLDKDLFDKAIEKYYGEKVEEL